MSNSWRFVTTIAKKEIIEFVRDWRTLLALIVIPLLIFPALFIALPLLLESEAAELDALELEIVWQGAINEDLQLAFNESQLAVSYEQLPTEISNLSDLGTDIDRLREQDTNAIFRLVQNDSEWDFAILHLSTSEASTEAKSRILLAIYSWESDVINGTLVEAGLDPESTLDPVKWDGEVSSSDAATKGEQAGLVLSLFIPMVIAIWTASSAIQPSIDMTAGERERGTLEALLCLPCSRMQLLAGKWLAVATITSTGVVLQISGLLFAITFLASTSIIGIPTISASSALLLISAVAIFAIMVVAFELAIAMKAHSVKEAGSLLGPAILFIIFPALFTQVINLDGIESWWFAIPLVNILLAMRELLLDRVIIEHVLVWLLSSIFYAGLAAWYAAKQFKREDLVASIS
ncbi:MAG: ABC transporter permease [Euryarchaeota archaeon]|jgi:sodium transport system permease protein|nr:ABC transporter permease [Euryarchaeota archaeon]MBT4982936.1 ABC transporter permease [Euryarchaeota archaeon]MBT5183685.1 ABC transporter permease [Euryarchaeota archaeon]